MSLSVRLKTCSKQVLLLFNRQSKNLVYDLESRTATSDMVAAVLADRAFSRQPKIAKFDRQFK